MSATGTDGCGNCGAVIGEAYYCSTCKSTAQVPINGVCADHTPVSRNAICTSAADGRCRTCAGDYFKFAGGCYETGQQPGQQICTTAEGGLCKVCASGITTSNGACSGAVCHASCTTCTTANDANACKTCAAGYYKESADNTTPGPCRLCSEALAGCAQRPPLTTSPCVLKRKVVMTLSTLLLIRRGFLRAPLQASPL